jgi:hypothetical protein
MHAVTTLFVIHLHRSHLPTVYAEQTTVIVRPDYCAYPLRSRDRDVTPSTEVGEPQPHQPCRRRLADAIQFPRSPRRHRRGRCTLEALEPTWRMERAVPIGTASPPGMMRAR